MAALALMLAPAPAPTPSATTPPPVFSLPLACTLGQTCEVQHYVDRDPGPGVRDYRCGPQSYQGHDGIDFRLPDMAAQRRGVDVLAAAAGSWPKAWALTSAPEPPWQPGYPKLIPVMSLRL